MTGLSRMPRKGHMNQAGPALDHSFHVYMERTQHGSVYVSQPLCVLASHVCLKWLSSLGEPAPQHTRQGDSEKAVLGHYSAMPLGQSGSES